MRIKLIHTCEGTVEEVFRLLTKYRFRYDDKTFSIPDSITVLNELINEIKAVGFTVNYSPKPEVLSNEDPFFYYGEWPYLHVKD